MTNPKELPPLSAAQLEMMNLVWEHREISVGEIWEILSRQREIARNTVQTTMTRLEEKGWLEHRKIGRTFLYRAVHAKKETQRNLVDQLVDAAFDGSAEGLVLALLEGRGLTEDEESKIRARIKESESNRHQEEKSEKQA